MKTCLLIIALFALLNCTTKQYQPSIQDFYQWLVDKNGIKAREWVQEQNEKTKKIFASDAQFETVSKNIEEKENKKDRIFKGEIYGAQYYQNYSDKDHPLGIWRRTDLSNYLHQQTKWETLVDLDSLSKAENVKYSLHDVNCIRPSFERCLLTFSIAGADIGIVREFSLSERKFIPNGFSLPIPFKHDVQWLNRDTVLLISNFGPTTISKGNRGLQVRLWKRGQPIDNAQVVYTTSKNDSIGLFLDYKNINPEDYIILADYSGFDTRTYRLFQNGNFDFQIDIPSDAEIVTIFKNQLIVKLLSAWNYGKDLLSKGSLIAIEPDFELKKSKVKIVYQPSENEVFKSALASSERLWVHSLKNLKNSLVAMDLKNGGWQSQKYLFDSEGSFDLSCVDSDRSSFFIYEENFLTPKRQFFVAEFIQRPILIQESPKSFPAEGMVSSLEWTKSRDGTLVPYYLIHGPNFKFDGETPTLIYGYGAANDMNVPWYLGNVGREWVGKGGVYVNAILRGGGELGTTWRTSGYKSEKQHTFDDLIAIAEDLLAKKVTSSHKLGIYGTSWGGLLVSVAMTQRPELFGAVAALMPMEDMLNFTLLPIGDSWTGEFGNPSNDEDYRVLSAYSPYHNISEKISYPPVLFFSSANDDRMHPAHARRMAAKMLDQKHEVYYFETEDGGHRGSMTNESYAKRWATIFRFLQKTLDLDSINGKQDITSQK